MSEDPVMVALQAMEARIIKQINDSTERILHRLSAVEGDVRNLRSEHSATREMVTRLPATVLAVMEQPMLARITELEKRVAKLDGEP